MEKFMSDVHLQSALELDRDLAHAVRRIRVLKNLEWPGTAEETFLKSWSAGTPALPDVRLEPVDYTRELGALEAIESQCDRGHPLGNLVYKNARSYAIVARMLGAIGTPEFTRQSILLYGRPDDVYRTQDWTGVDAAEFFLTVTDELLRGSVIPPAEPCIPAEEFAESLRRSMAQFFTEDDVKVVLDPNLASKAVAGSNAVRLRASALFSELDLAQLLQHEAFVHTATMLNGKKQPLVRCLGLGAPRTTRTQEGIAVIAEVFTLSLDIARMRRVALRVRALALALAGADFIEIFCTFLEAGQSERESFRSAARIFRGGDVRGKVPYTKDCVYLKGLLEVHAFLRVAIGENRPELIERLFAGRLTLADTLDLEPLFDSGVLSHPVYVPPWAQDLRRLAALLAYSAFSSRVDLRSVTLENFRTLEDHQS
jgi:uncharacterized protein (TIGR02421 family)